MESEWIQIRLFLLRIPHFPIQASDDTPQEDTFERKITRLQKIRGAHPTKTIIAKTGHETTGRNDIKLISLARRLMGQACKVGEWRRKGNPPVPTKLDERTCVALIPRPASRCAFSTGMQSPAQFHYRRCRQLALQTPRQRDRATYRCAFQPPCDSIPWNAPIQQNLPVRRPRVASFRQNTSPWQ